MATLITSSSWALSLEGVDMIVQGEDDINQCIEIILKTIKGSCPFNVLFGCSALEQIDGPINKVKADMTASIIEALGLWEPRINVTSVTSQVVVSEIEFLITYEIKNTGVSTQTTVSFGLT